MDRGRRLLRAAAPAAVLLICVVVLSGCGLVGNTPQTTLAPRSDVADKIQDLLITTVVWGLIVVVPVELILLFTVLRFRRRRGQVVGPPVGRHGSTRLEIAWTLVPVLILTAIAIPTVQTIFATAAPAPAGSIKVQVIAHQWWWEFRYPKYHIVTANELHIPVNQTTDFALGSADVIHSFWIPAFDGKRDVFANHWNDMWFTPHVTGVFPGQCAEFCGEAHAYMQMTTVVQTPAQFAAWVRHEQQKEAAIPKGASAQIQRGATLFAQGTCAGCHTISGTAAQGAVGPNLTHVGSRLNIGVQESMPNTPANLAAWIANSSAFKPGSHMPAQHLSKSDLAAVVAYLRSLK